MKKIYVTLLLLAATLAFRVGSGFAAAIGGDSADTIPQTVMQAVYAEVKTPYKFGLVVAPTDNYHKIDCPTVWCEDGRWLMSYVVYNGKDGTDGRGYETWLASSDDLLHWTTLGRVLALPQQASQQSQSYRKEPWDMNQRGGFPALIDWTWGGSYAMQTYKGKHWMTYIGGHGTGYEAVREPLNIGLAWTKDNIGVAHEWQSADKPLLSIDDKDAQWWEKLTQYKSTVYDDPQKTLGKRFVMFYNAGGVNPANNLKAERIGIALSNDMRHWRRYEGNPVYSHEAPGIITGDAQIVKMGDLYVMFYFSAYNPERKYNAFNTFAVSRDLLHWQDWEGEDLIWPSKTYDELFAHKSYVVKHDGVVYHFYCAVNNAQQRGIAVATSVPMGRSAVRFPEPEPTGKRSIISLNQSWRAQVLSDNSSDRQADTIGGFTVVNVPHNFDDYYGYRQLRHGNLHGSAIYNKRFACAKHEGKRYFLQFEGVGTYATVTLNGRQYPKELVGRTVWTLDVTDALRDGDNELSVLVDHPAMQTASPWVCGGCSSEYGFSEGSQPFGIFRPVTLVETDAVRIEPFGVHIWANEACDSVFIETEVKNYSAIAQTVELVNKFAQANGKQVFRLSEPVVLSPGETRTIRQTSPVADAHRWSLDDPYLYTLTSMVKRDNKTTDDVRTPFGLRSLCWPVSPCSAPVSLCHDTVAAKPTDNRFRLNGQPVFINGTCEYEHLLGQSHAFTPEQIRSRVKQIRNAGFNAFREAHQPHNLLYQQLFDEQGMLFWSQFSAHIWYDTSEFRQSFLRLLERWIRERRNSPSVILWGLQNESVLPRDFAEECTALIRRLDPTASSQRLVTTCNGGEGTDWNVIQNWSGTYGGSAENYAEELSRPDQLLNGEYGAWRTLDLHGADKYSEESFTALLALKDSLAMEAFVSRGTASASSSVPSAPSAVPSAPSASPSPLAFADSLGVCGHFQWLFASHDNPGRTQPDGAFRRIDRVGPVNHKGLTTIWEEPTQAYYLYRRRHVPAVLPAGAAIASLPAGEVSALAHSPIAHPCSLLQAAPNYRYLYRINCGGDAYIDEYDQHWQADDSLLSHSWGQDFPGIHPFQASQRHIADDIRNTDSDALFQSFRFGRHRLWYDLPVPSVAVLQQQTEHSPRFRIELYFLEPWHGKGGGEQDDYEGLRIFDVAVNDSIVIDDLDPWAEAGYCGAIKRVVWAKANDGRLRISFPEVKAGQAVIAAIAVAIEETGANGMKGTTGAEGYTGVTGTNGEMAKRASWLAFDTDTIAKLPKEELPLDLDPRPATVYEPLESQGSHSSQRIHSSHKPHDLQSSPATTFVITPGLGQEYALRFRYKNTTGAAVKARMTITDAKHTMLVDRELTFPPTPNKFKMLSTTTGTQINAGTYTLRIDSRDIEFKDLEIQ